MKQILSGAILAILCILMPLGQRIIYAGEIGETTEVYANVSANINDMYGYSALMYDNAETDELWNAKVLEIAVSENVLCFEANGCVQYVDIVGKMADGKYVNLSRQVTVFSCDESVATYDCGRICAQGKGNTTIHLLYGEYLFDIDVTVESEVVWEDYFNALIASLQQEEDIMAHSVPGKNLSLVMTRAGNMAFVEWVAMEDFTMNDGTVKQAGTLIKGVPYALRSVVYDDIGFLEKYNEYNAGAENGFYDIFPREKSNKKIVYDAKYGLDCSGFLSFAWGTPRRTTSYYRNALANLSMQIEYEKVGSYDYDGTNFDTEELKKAYESLSVGDAVVNGTHCRLVSTNDVSQEKIIFIEAGGNTPAIYSYTYDTLAKEGYLPFTISTDYFESLSKNQ